MLGLWLLIVGSLVEVDALESTIWLLLPLWTLAMHHMLEFVNSRSIQLLGLQSRCFDKFQKRILILQAVWVHLPLSLSLYCLTQHAPLALCVFFALEVYHFIILLLHTITQGVKGLMLAQVLFVPMIWPCVWLCMWFNTMPIMVLKVWLGLWLLYFALSSKVLKQVIMLGIQG
jgi:hypothetical protein